MVVVVVVGCGCIGGGWWCVKVRKGGKKMVRDILFLGVCGVGCCS